VGSPFRGLSLSNGAKGRVSKPNKQAVTQDFCHETVQLFSI